jgi:spore germination protein GerM
MAKKRSRNRASFGVLFWVAAILLVAVLLMFNLPAIRGVLDSTDFVEVVFEERSGADQPGTDSPDTGDSTPEQPTVRADDAVSPAASTDEPDAQPEDTGEVAAPTPSDDAATDSEQSETPGTSDEAAQAERVSVVTAPPAREPESGPQRSLTGTLFFIRVSDDGRILAEPVRRTISYEGGPLTRTIEELIAGPSADDLNRQLLSLIPEDTELLSARVASGVAFLNFNDAFRFNPMGLEGLLAQLQQVVLTATQFSTVDAVQFLIEGRELDYLGGDGVFVGEPIEPGDLRR